MTRTFAPPTAGLPLRWADFLPGGASDLGEALASQLGLPCLQIECSGTAALVIGLTTLRRLAPSRTELVVPAYTCPLVAIAAAHCGLQVRACELLPQGLDMDPAALAQLCSERTLAVVPTHLAGRVADVASARACAKAVGAKVFEDAAQALGATIQGRSVGADSDLAFFSLAVGKGLTLYEGGALYVRDAALREACRESAAALAPWRPSWELLRCLQLLAVGALYRPACLPWAYGWGLRRALHRDDWIGAAGEHFSTKIPLHRVGRWRRAVGRRALQRLPQFLARSRQQAALRIERLRRIAGLLVLDDSPAADRADGTWPVILLLLPDRERRDAVLRRMWAGGWGLSLPFVHALPDHPACAGAVMPVAADDLPNARDLAARLLAVSNSPWLGNAAFDVVCRELKSVLAGAEPVRGRSDLRFRAVAAGPAPPGR